MDGLGADPFFGGDLQTNQKSPSDSPGTVFFERILELHHSIKRHVGHRRTRAGHHPLSGFVEREKFIRHVPRVAEKETQYGD